MESVKHKLAPDEDRSRTLDALTRKHPLLWRGHRHEGVAYAVIPTGFSELDEALPGGGWPSRGLLEVNVASWGQGELSLFLPLMRCFGAEPRGEAGLLVWVAPPYTPYAPALQQAGVSLAHLWVLDARVSAKDQLWAVEQCLQQPGALVMFWPLQINHKAVQRLRLAAINSGALGVMLRSQPSDLPVDVRIRVQRLIPDGFSSSVSASNSVSTLAIDVLNARYHFIATQRVRVTLDGEGAW